MNECKAARKKSAWKNSSRHSGDVSASKNPFERVVGTLCLAGLLKQKLAALTDVAVGQLMFDYVCDEMNVFGPESTICQEATERLLHPSPMLVKA